MTDRILADVAALERRLLQPETRSDSKALETLLHDEFYEIGPGGRMWTREEILAELAERPADLLVLGTHGLGGFDRLVIGSVAADVVREAPASVLVVPPGARREA